MKMKRARGRGASLDWLGEDEGGMVLRFLDIESLCTVIACSWFWHHLVLRRCYMCLKKMRQAGVYAKSMYPEKGLGLLKQLRFVQGVLRQRNRLVTSACNCPTCDLHAIHLQHGKVPPILGHLDCMQLVGADTHCSATNKHTLFHVLPSSEGGLGNVLSEGESRWGWMGDCEHSFKRVDFVKELRCLVICQVAVGQRHALFLTDTGHAFGMGQNSCLQLGDPNIPRQVHKPYRIAKGVHLVAAAGRGTMLLKSNGSVLGCGCNDYYNLGLPRCSRFQMHGYPLTLVEGSLSAARVCFISMHNTLTVFLDSLGKVHFTGVLKGHRTQVRPLALYAPVTAINVAAGRGVFSLIDSDHTCWSYGDAHGSERKSMQFKVANATSMTYFGGMLIVARDGKSHFSIADL